MLKDILDRVDSTLQFTSLEEGQRRWPDITADFGMRFVPIVDDLLTMVRPMVVERVWDESREEFLAAGRPNAAILGYRLRPMDDYYERLGRSPPRPANPQSHSETGLELSFHLIRGFNAVEGKSPAFLALDFQIWGEHERKCFSRLLRDHRFLVEQLVTRSGAKLFTHLVFDNMEQGLYASTFEQLLLYYGNAVDGANMFALQCKFNGRAKEDDIMGALLPLLILYDAALGYCLPVPSPGRILEHVPVIGKLA